MSGTDLSQGESESTLRRNTLRGKKGSWTNDEDLALQQWVRTFGAQRWTECSKVIPGRCGKQCRERWVNILNPVVKKGDWSNYEQTKIFEALQTYSTAWSTIARLLHDRTENSIKNYFYSSLRRIKAGPLIELLRDRVLLSDPRVQSQLKKLNELGARLGELAFSKGEESPLRNSILSFLEFEDKSPKTVSSKKQFDVNIETPEEETAISISEPENSVVFKPPKCWNCLLRECLRHSPQQESL